MLTTIETYWTRNLNIDQEFNETPLSVNVKINDSPEKGEYFNLFMSRGSSAALLGVLRTLQIKRLFRVLKREYRGQKAKFSNEYFFLNHHQYHGLKNGKEKRYDFVVIQDHPLGHTTKTMMGKNGKQYDIEAMILFDEAPVYTVPDTISLNYIPYHHAIYVQSYASHNTPDLNFNYFFTIKENGQTIFDGDFYELKDQQMNLLEELGVVEYGEIKNLPENTGGHIFYNENEIEKEISLKYSP
jgi:hypothetical protein